ncbi:uncharacterized protein [Diabrotica undecimpunctata]|uniref:uncharacterized protein n=1 Tax=Diabrotica undecimpunctata TaxID=50387 RepID=UPI003B63C5D9
MRQAVQPYNGNVRKKILTKKGKHQIGSISTGEGRVNTTVVCCASAAGQFIPPMIIFKRKRFQEQLSLDAPPDSNITISDTEYISSNLFVTWLNHFVETVKSSPEATVLFLLDGHSTHSKNLKDLHIARSPSHTTHRLQPLDIGFFRAFKNGYGQGIQKWLRNNVGRTLSMF